MLAVQATSSERASTVMAQSVILPHHALLTSTTMAWSMVPTWESCSLLGGHAQQLHALEI
jgi:hypothetical protein